MNPNEKSSNTLEPKIKIEPGLQATPTPTIKKTNATQALPKKSRSAILSPPFTSGNVNALPAVKIKIEPGLSSVPSTSVNAPFPVPKIKIEPGLSNALHPSRLTSFRPARDLTLTGNMKPEKPNKKVFTPNLNVQRNKRKDDGTAVKCAAGPSRGKSKVRGRGQNDRGRGRGRGASNVTQSTGVFSEGISEISRSARRVGGGGRSSANSDREARAQLEKPKLNLNISVDKASEEQKLKLLLRDDFIDDGGDDINQDNTPISLPLIKELKLYKNESEEDISLETKVVQKDEEKKSILKNGKDVISASHKNVEKPSSPVTLSVPDIIENESNGYMVLRFPDCLPGLQSYDDTQDQNNHHRNHNEKKQPPDNNAENKNKTKYCTLRSLKAGHLGKLQIHQSGKARLLLGDNSLVVDMGSRLGFRQDVVAAKVDGLNKELVNLGRVTSTLICTPDFESILAKM